MTTETGQLADAVLVAHAKLLGSLERLENLVQPNSAVTSKSLLTALRGVQHEVLEHFSFEEAGGYMSPVRQRIPQLCGRVQALLDQHRALAGVLQTLVDAAQEAASRGAPSDKLRQQVHAWTRDLREHEAAENRMLQEVINWDFTAED